MLIVGEPGIGKSALLAACRRRAARRGIRVVRIDAVDGESALPFAMLDDLHRVLEPASPPWSGDAPERSVALLAVLTGLAAGGPVLVVLDEAQHADAASLEAFAIAVERGADLPICAVVAAEPDRASTPRLCAWPTIVLGPLSSEASAAVLRAACGPSGAPAVLAALSEAWAGNALALVETPRLLTIDQIAGRAPLPPVLPVPPGLDRVWGERWTP